MSNILWIVRKLSADPHHGGYLRVVNLARELSHHRRSYLAILNDRDDVSGHAEELGIFDDVLSFRLRSKQKRFAKYFRLSNIHFTARSYPDYFGEVTERLAAFVRERKIETVIGVTIKTAEFLDMLPCKSKVIDDYDCVTLTIERYMNAGEYPRTLTAYAQYLRIKQLEKSLTSRFPLVTTISRADQRRLQQLARRRPGAIEIVKNGVDQDFLEYDASDPPLSQCVAFWGNLSFRPNTQAVHFFYDRIYLPYLEKLGIRWYIIGANANASILSMAENHENIQVAGFVPDLAALVTRIPIMINPMVSGSGLKNKVLEAFALRRAVVSTKMGAEAIEATPGQHFLQADAPDEFAGHIIDCLRDSELQTSLSNSAYDFVVQNYQWSNIGTDFEALIARIESSNR